MPRKSSGQKEAQRQRQVRYRQRLAEKREPEVAELDSALAVAIAGLVNDLEAMAMGLKALEAKAFQSDEAKAEAEHARAGLLDRKAMIDKIMIASVDHLRSKNFSGIISGRLMRRRLTWIKETLKNPAATALQKRGFYL